MMNRREFTVAAAVGIAAPSLAFAAPPQRRADLKITELRWSTDAGITFDNGPAIVDDDVWFEAVVQNGGKAAWPSGTLLRVDFSVSGQLVTWSDTHVSGLGPRQSITLRANAGINDNEFWIAGQEGAVTVRAQADPGNLVLESGETDNTRSATLTIEPAPRVVFPTPNDDLANTPVDTTVTIMVLENDSDPLGRTLSVSSVQSPTVEGGTAIITGDAKAIRYTPPPGFKGQDLFMYEVSAA